MNVNMNGRANSSFKILMVLAISFIYMISFDIFCEGSPQMNEHSIRKEFHEKDIVLARNALVQDTNEKTKEDSAAPSLSPTMSSPSNSTNTTAAPSTSVSPSQVPTITNSPSISTAPSSVPTIMNTTDVTNAPSAIPTQISNNTNATTSVPSAAPTIPSGNTLKPTKRYTSSPTSSPTTTDHVPKKKKHGFVYYLSKITFWTFSSIIAFLVFGKCMAHRVEITHFLTRIWFGLKHIGLAIKNFVSNSCVSLQEYEIMHKIGYVFANIGNSIRGLFDRIRNRFGGGGPTSVVDDDGSTMMQGLLMRENL